MLRYTLYLIPFQATFKSNCMLYKRNIYTIISTIQFLLDYIIRSIVHLNGNYMCLIYWDYHIFFVLEYIYCLDIISVLRLLSNTSKLLHIESSFQTKITLSISPVLVKKIPVFLEHNTILFCFFGYWCCIIFRVPFRV